jgi:DNA-binding transcriptional regulator YdaS (Cro superfamily)
MRQLARVGDARRMSNDRGRAFWEKLVREVAAGGRLVAVAKRNGVSPSWLGKWCGRLREETPPGALLPIRVVEGRVRRVDLAVGGVRLSFDEGTDPAYVALVARALAS